MINTTYRQQLPTLVGPAPHPQHRPPHQETRSPIYSSNSLCQRMMLMIAWLEQQRSPLSNHRNPINASQYRRIECARVSILTTTHPSKLRSGIFHNAPQYIEKTENRTIIIATTPTPTTFRYILRDSLIVSVRSIKWDVIQWPRRLARAWLLHTVDQVVCERSVTRFGKISTPLVE